MANALPVRPVRYCFLTILRVKYLRHYLASPCISKRGAPESASDVIYERRKVLSSVRTRWMEEAARTRGGMTMRMKKIRLGVIVAACIALVCWALAGTAPAWAQELGSITFPTS